ncbi:MAG: alpha/beta hydrolase family protein [Syntrophorhabdaceae bacterium]
MQGKYSETLLSIPVDDRRQTSGVLAIPDGEPEKTAIIVAHGAGNNMTTPLIEAFTRGMAGAGYPALRFNFLYAEQAKKAPDSQIVLEKTWSAVYEYARTRLDLNASRWVAAGKSMGGRIASQLAADGKLPVDRLVFLGYPLHPANDPERLRDSHLYRIRIPMLFFAGTRDPLCNIQKLTDVLQRLDASYGLVTIEGGDHSFHIPKSRHKTEEEIHQEIIIQTIDWLSR